jgi:hypothetical protein
MCKNKLLNLISKEPSMEHKIKHIYNYPKEHARALLVNTLDSF